MTTNMLRMMREDEASRNEMVAPSERGLPERELDASVNADRRSSVDDRSAGMDLRGIDLRSLIARAVVPRVCHALRDRPTHRGSAVDQIDTSSETPIAEQVDELVEELLRADDLANVVRRIDALRERGRTLEFIYLHLLTPTAIGIGRMVDDDLCSAAAGTIALCNLQIVLRRYASAFYAEGRPIARGSRALLVAPVGGSQATRGVGMFGLVLTADVLRRAGWDTWTETSLRSTSCKQAVLAQWFDLVEILAGEDDDLDEIASGISNIRCGAPNPHVPIVACGRVFSDNPGLVRQIGADHAARDPLSFLPFLHRLTSRQLRQAS